MASLLTHKGTLNTFSSSYAADMITQPHSTYTRYRIAVGVKDVGQSIRDVICCFQGGSLP